MKHKFWLNSVLNFMAFLVVIVGGLSSPRLLQAQKFELPTVIVDSASAGEEIPLDACRSSANKIVQSVELPSIAPAWVAVRRQYDPGYEERIQRNDVMVVQSAIPAWQATRRQYDPGYEERIQRNDAIVVQSAIPAWQATRRQYDPGYEARLQPGRLDCA